MQKLGECVSRMIRDSFEEFDQFIVTERKIGAIKPDAIKRVRLALS